MLDEEGHEHRLSDDDVAAFSVLIAGAGSETVTKLIGSGIVLFDQHPEQWELVQNDRALIPHAVEEILRMHPPSQYQGRFAIAPVEFDGGTIPAESPVILLTGAATRDPRVYERPDTFDITRGGRTTLAFGYGVHGCLGAWLARLESNLAFEGIRSRWPQFRGPARRPAKGQYGECRRVLQRPGGCSLARWCGHFHDRSIAPSRLTRLSFSYKIPWPCASSRKLTSETPGRNLT